MVICGSQSSTRNLSTKLSNPIGRVLAALLNVVERLLNDIGGLLVAILKLLDGLLPKIVQVLTNVIENLGLTVDDVLSRLKCVIIHPLHSLDCFKKSYLKSK